MDRINTYVCKLTSKDSVAEKRLDVSLKYAICLSCLPSEWDLVGEITITARYKILIQKIIFLFWRDSIVSRVLDKTLRCDESLSVVEFPQFYDSNNNFDKMIIVTNKGDFLFRCDEQTKQEIDEHIDISKLLERRNTEHRREREKYFKESIKEWKIEHNIE